MLCYFVSVRLLLFCAVWVLTFGNHHFWFLPNLTEDVGFFDSFKPLYKHDAVGREVDADKDNKPSKTAETKDGESTQEVKADTEDKKEEVGQEEAVLEDSGSELSQDNGYEIVNPEDVEANGEDEEGEGEKDGGEEDEETEESSEPKKMR